MSRTETTGSALSGTSSGAEEKEKEKKRHLPHLRGAGGRHHSKKKSESDALPFALPEKLTPVTLVETAITTAFTVPGPSIDQLRDVILPQLYHEAYSHR